MGLKIEVGEELKAAWTAVAPLLPRARSILRSYIRSDRRGFELQSGGPVEVSYKVSLLLCTVATAIYLGWAGLIAAVLGERFSWAIWTVIKHSVVLSLVVAVGLYLGLRLFGGKRRGLFVINLMAVSTAIVMAISAVLFVVGMAASGSLYEDFVAARQGDRTSAYSRLMCEPYELQLQIERDYQEFGTALRRYDSYHRAATGLPPDTLEAEKYLTMEERAELAILYMRILAMRRQTEAGLARRDAHPEWKDWRSLWGEYLPFTIAFALAMLTLLPVLYRNFVFMMSSIEVRGRRPRPARAFGRVAFASLLSLVLCTIYGGAAQGVPFWVTDPDERYENEMDSVGRVLRPFCGPPRPGYSAGP